MKKNYGLPYKGSKNKIAQWIVDLLPPGGTFYDLFCGGCAVTHCAMESGKWDRFVINDIDEQMPKFFLDAIQGKFKNRNEWISREDFFRLKDSDPFVRCVWSFGNHGRTYLYSSENERIKGLAQRMLTAETVHDRRLLYRQLMMELRKSVFLDKHNKRVGDIQRLERLQRLESLQRLERLQKIETYGGDYQKVDLKKNGVIYCDIPYRKTEKYICGKFDYERFYDWCERQTLPVYISELWMPEDRFIAIAEKEIKHTINDSKGKQVTEKVFIPRGQMNDTYNKRRMRELELFLE